MTALSTTEGYVATPSALTSAAKFGSRYAPAEFNLDADSREMLSILGRTLFFLSLGTVGVVTITGQLPLFFLPLGLFLICGSAMRWRQTHPARAGMTRQTYESSEVSKEARDEPRTRYTDTA